MYQQQIHFVAFSTYHHAQKFYDICFCLSSSSQTTTTTILRPFFQDHPGEPVPEENFWTLLYKRRLTEADTLTIWLGATPSGLTSALPAAQPTVSKH